MLLLNLIISRTGRGAGGPKARFLHGSGTALTILHAGLGGGSSTPGSTRAQEGGPLAVFLKKKAFVAFAVAHSTAAGVGATGDEPPSAVRTPK